MKFRELGKKGIEYKHTKAKILRWWDCAVFCSYSFFLMTFACFYMCVYFLDTGTIFHFFEGEGTGLTTKNARNDN